MRLVSFHRDIRGIMSGRHLTRVEFNEILPRNADKHSAVLAFYQVLGEWQTLHANDLLLPSSPLGPIFPNSNPDLTKSMISPIFGPRSLLGFDLQMRGWGCREGRASFVEESSSFSVTKYKDGFGSVLDYTKRASKNWGLVFWERIYLWRA